jgi:hypothetical protein
MSDRKVIVARLHAPVHVVGFGQLGGSGAAITTTWKTTNDLDLTKTVDGLNIKGKGFEVFVPSANVISMQLAPENNG